MKKLIILSLIILPLGLTAQWNFQVGIGRVLGTKDAFGSAQLTDTLSYSYLKKGLNTTSAAFMATHRIKEKLLFRTGIEGNSTSVEIRIKNTKTGLDIYDERRIFADFRIPFELQFEVNKAVFLNGGLSTNIRFDNLMRLPLEELVVRDQPFGRPVIVEAYEKTAYNSIRMASLNYRVGVTVKPLPWLGVDFMYDRPFGSLVKPLKYEGDKAKAKFKYKTLTLRLTYFFEWEKLKATLSK